MSLSYDDLQEIRKVVEKAIDPLTGEVQALGSDIKEVYGMITELQKAPNNKDSFQKLDLEKKILKLHTEVVEAAKQAGITLPSH